MKLTKIEWKNFASYGNKPQKLEFSDDPNLYLVVGENGAGKCFSRDTKLKIRVGDSVREKLNIFRNLKNP